MLLASIWSRVSYGDWQENLPIIGFAIFTAIFLCAVFLTLRMKRKSIEHLANLPLEDNEISTEQK